jgi:hypothetical protein
MPIAPRRTPADELARSPRTIALAKDGPAPGFHRRPAILPLGARRPARRLGARGDVPAVSRIVLRSLSLR